MDDRRFDDLTRVLGRGLSRRAALKGAVTGLALAFGGRGAAGAQQARCGNVSCGKNPGKCKPGCVCCVYGNGNSRCMPPESCSGTVLVVCPNGQRVCPGTGRCGACCGDAECAGLNDSCGTGVCDATTGQCGRAPLGAGTACGAGDACTAAPACDGSGTCVQGAPKDCSGVADACHVGACNPATGACDPVAANEGGACDDGDACTAGDACAAGQCTGQPITCDDGIACTDNQCDPVSGCIHPVSAGACLIAGTCFVVGDRNPANPCQVCDPARNQTTWSNATQGMACDDATLCNGREACDGAGSCVAGIAVNCAPPQSCQEAGVCDAATGVCSYALKASGTPCSDAAACVAAADCDGVTVTCPAGAVNVGETCDDGDPCTTEDVCQEDGSCAGTPLACDDGLKCTISIRDPVAGCVHTPYSSACAIDRTCYPDGFLNPANDCQVCLIDNNDTAWSSVGDGVTCGEGNRCLSAAVCQNGVCTGTSTVCPVPAGICEQSSCNPDTGACDIIPITKLSSVSRGCDVCPSCVFGVCVGSIRQRECPTCQACNPETGTCAQVPEGTDCGSTCDTRLTCGATGFCSGISVPGNGCITVGECPAKVCDPGTLACVETGANDGNTCGGDLCHVCAGGKCVPKSCGPCEHCDAATGACVTCEPCCNGICGHSACGRRGCCGGDRECCTSADGGQVYCWNKDEVEVCMGVCFFDPVVCCGMVDLAGLPVTCPIGQTCCSTGSVIVPEASCCTANQVCGQFGCSTV